MKITGSHVLAARDLLGLTQGELAEAADVALSTIVRFETGKADPYPASVEKIRAELEKRGIELTNGNGIGVRLNFDKAAEYARSTKQKRP
jgi:predicted transcriptional regulator